MSSFPTPPSQSSAAPEFSVVIPTWRRPALLVERAIASVRRQTVNDFECLVVSDGPDEATFLAVLEVTNRDPRVRYLALPEHQGGWGAPARAHGARYAKAPLIAYLDDDNAWRPNHLAALAAAFRDPAIVFAYTQMVIVQTGEVIGAEPPRIGCIDSSLIAHRAGVLEHFGGWPGAEAGYMQDGETVERWVRNGARWRFVPEVTVDYYRTVR